MYALSVQMENELPNFGKWLSEAMASAGIKNQSELSRLSGVSKQHINGILAQASGRGQKAKRPGIETVDALAKILKRPKAEARLAAGWAADQTGSVTGETALLSLFRDLPADQRHNLLVIAQALHARGQSAQPSIEEDLNQKHVEKTKAASPINIEIPAETITPANDTSEKRRQTS